MDIVALSGNDTVIINNRVLTGLVDNDNSSLEFPNEIATVKVGKDGNATFAINQQGRMANLSLRVIRGCSDDKFLNNLLSQQQANFAGFPLMTGEFVKQIGDGAGNVASDTYVSSGGVHVKQVAAKSNAEGDSEQNVAVYAIRFSKCVRVID